MKLPNLKYWGTCTICGKPVHNKEEIVANKPKGRRGWVCAHAECLGLRAQQKDSGVRLK